MAVTQIADLWVPDIWIAGIDEKMNTFPSLFNSPAVAKGNARLNEACEGPGNSVTMPFFNDITGQVDEIQVEGGAITKQKIGSSDAISVMLNRQSANSVSALSGQIAGRDPLDAILGQIAMKRTMQYQSIMLAQSRGVFATALAANSTDSFSESVAGQTADHLLDADLFIDANAARGELSFGNGEGSIWMHSVVAANLRKQDENSFERTSTAGGLVITTYKGIPLYINDALVRVGTTDGFVYDTYVLGAGVIHFGSKGQMGDVIDVASLQFDPSKSVNEQSVYDRNRLSFHIDGLRWTGTPAGQSPTNAELQTAGNWALGYATADRVSAIRIQTNG